MEFKEVRLLNLIPSKNLRTERVPDIQELADSIKQHGLLQPIRVRHLYGETYQIIAGHRRVQAFRALGIKVIPSIVVTERDEAAAVQSIVENLQREDLTPLELARGIQDLAKGFNLNAEAISRLVSKSPARVRTWLRFSSLPDDVLGKLESGEGRTQSVTGLTPRHIEPFVRGLPSEEAVQSDERKAARYEERVSDVRELQEEVERRDVHINAHMADAIAKETREGTVSVAEAIDKVLAAPERYRYRKASSAPDAPAAARTIPKPVVESQDSEMEVFARYQQIHADLIALASKLNAEAVAAFSEEQKGLLLESVASLDAVVQPYREALATNSSARIEEAVGALD